MERTFSATASLPSSGKLAGDADRIVGESIWERVSGVIRLVIAVPVGSTLVGRPWRPSVEFNAPTNTGPTPVRYSIMHILIVEDDEVARDYLAKALRGVGHTVDVAANGLEGLHMASSLAVDLAIVDRMLPKLDGLALVQSLRATGRKMPVLILSALGDVDDRITGLRAGGDDYLTKPYHMSELLARIDALARRGDSGNAEANTKLKLADLELDRMTRRVTRNGKKIELTAREFQLLEFMMRHSGQVVTRTMLLEGVWDYHFDPQTNVIDVHISRLRQAIDKDFDKPLLHTVRGAGYSLREDE
jgi:two-component system, OmpR family, response regulator